MKKLLTTMLLLISIVAFSQEPPSYSYTQWDGNAILMSLKDDIDAGEATVTIILFDNGYIDLLVRFKDKNAKMTIQTADELLTTDGVKLSGIGYLGDEEVGIYFENKRFLTIVFKNKDGEAEFLTIRR